MARPPKDPTGPAQTTLTIRLTAEDRATLDRLVAARAAKLADEAGEVTATSYLRAIIRREGRLLDAAGPEPAVDAAEPAPAVLPAPKTATAPKPATGVKPAQVRAALERALRDGRTQMEIADAAGFDRSRLSRFKNGADLSPESLEALNRALH